MSSTDPTPEQIAAMCKLIQSEWTPQERLKRLRSDWRGDIDGPQPSMATKAALTTPQPAE